MADMAAMAARYETLQEDEVIVPSGKGHTDASAAAAMEKWGKNEIPEEKEPLRRHCREPPVGPIFLPPLGRAFLCLSVCLPPDLRASLP